MTSLRGRLFIAVMVVFGALWIGWPLFIVEQIWRGETGFWDVSLKDTAESVVATLPEHPGPETAVPEMGTPVDVGGDSELHGKQSINSGLSYQVWVGGRLVLRSPSAPAVPLDPAFHDGASRHLVDADSWWVYTASDPRRHLVVQVGRPHRQLEHDLRGLTNFSLIASAVMLLVLSVAMWLVIRWSLAPVAAVRRAVEARAAFDLTPLPSARLPSEVRPLVDSFNRLLGQLDQAVQGERRFIADAAHELRTPLAVLTADAHVALQANGDAERAAALERLGAGVERAARLAEQLLDLARLDAAAAPAREALDLCPLVELVLRDFAAQAARRRQHILFDGAAVSLRGDADQLGILVRNLVDNALRFSGEGGRVAVTVTVGDAGGAELRVADNGPGVPPAERARIFDRFYRVAGSGQRGSGIGLSLVARIAESHGATIDVGDGLDGKGFGITLRFPAVSLPG